MAKITRTIRVRGSKLTTGFIFFFTAISLLIIGWLKDARGLVWTAVVILVLLAMLSLVRRRTVVTLDEKGIRYKSPFWDLHFLWNEVQSCGIYYVRNREVYRTQAEHAEITHREGWPLTIFVSTRANYFPSREDRFINRRDIHFRWNREAWDVIARNVSREALGGV